MSRPDIWEINTDDTQYGRILHLLRTMPEGICTFHLTYTLSPGIPRAAARVHEIRHDGWPVATEVCDLPDHANMRRHIKYRLKGWDEE